MSLIYKYFIVGCARTGTTLVRRLFNAFSLSVYNDNEISLNELIKSRHQVGKRTSSSPFAGVLSDEKTEDMIKEAKQHNVLFINVARDKHSTLISGNGYVPKERYERSVRQAQKYASHIAYTIYYEELISNPDKVQADISKTFGFKINHLFSDYPKFYHHSNMLKDPSYSLRKIGEKYKK